MFLPFFFLSLTGVTAGAAINCPNWASSSSLSNPNKCFFFGIEKLPYMKAEEECAKLGGHLATPDSNAENIELSQKAAMIFNGSGATDFWFGVNKVTGKWAWMAGSNFNVRHWAISEQKNGQENICGAISLADGKWSAQNCFKNKPYVCELAGEEGKALQPTTTNAMHLVIFNYPPHKQCSTDHEYSCGERLKKRAEQVCCIPKELINIVDCDDYKLYRMCCENMCSDCEIKQCRCPDFQ